MRGCKMKECIFKNKLYHFILCVSLYFYEKRINISTFERKKKKNLNILNTLKRIFRSFSPFFLFKTIEQPLES